MMKLEESWTVGMTVLRKTYRDELTEENSGITNIEATTQIADTQPQKNSGKRPSSKQNKILRNFSRKKKLTG